jgi:hypothetical protein
VVLAVLVFLLIDVLEVDALSVGALDAEYLDVDVLSADEILFVEILVEILFVVEVAQRQVVSSSFVRNPYIEVALPQACVDVPDGVGSMPYKNVSRVNLVRVVDDHEKNEIVDRAVYARAYHVAVYAHDHYFLDYLVRDNCWDDDDHDYCDHHDGDCAVGLFHVEVAKSVIEDFFSNHSIVLQSVLRFVR